LSPATVAAKLQLPDTNAIEWPIR